MGPAPPQRFPVDGTSTYRVRLDLRFQRPTSEHRYSRRVRGNSGGPGYCGKPSVISNHGSLLRTQAWATGLNMEASSKVAAGIATMFLST
jgi:hypothetical protein